MSGLYASRWASTPSPTESKSADDLLSDAVSKLVGKDKMDGTVDDERVAKVEKVESVHEESEAPVVANDPPQEDESIPSINGNGIDGKQENDHSEEVEAQAQPVRSTLSPVSQPKSPLEKPLPPIVNDEVQSADARKASMDKELPQPPRPDEDESYAPTQEAPLQSTEESTVPSEPITAEDVQSISPDREMNATPIKSPVKTDSTRLEPPRLRKRVSWRGKNCIIYIPRVDFTALGLPMPMSSDEVAARVKGFEDAGYNTTGFDLTPELDESAGLASNRPVYPDEFEIQQTSDEQQPKVTLPDLQKWTDYMDWLTEQKLAALGVSLGLDEPEVAAGADMSRQSSAQYPPSVFSPPIPTASANSMGRPGMVRGHSHTMSMASPVSISSNPQFGHAHRASIVGTPFMFPNQHNVFPGLQTFSPPPQLGLSRGTSPAQLAGLRGMLGTSVSPLHQQILQQSQSPQDFARSMLDDQLRRPSSFSFPQQAQLFNPLLSQLSPLHRTPTLPELPEEDDEEAEALAESESQPQLQARQPSTPEPELQAYVPPHKRTQLNGDIAVPTPRGHRHNISEGLEREILEAEKRNEVQKRDRIDEFDEDERSSISRNSKKSTRSQFEKDPLSSNLPVHITSHARKKSTARFNVAAPVFTFNPAAMFTPGNTEFVPKKSEFTFEAAGPKIKTPVNDGHSRKPSSGTLNVAAPVFRPQGIPKTDFSFSTQGPAFPPAETVLEPYAPSHKHSVDGLPSIFGNIEIPDIKKPSKNSKAIPIIRPEDVASASDSGSGAHTYDSDGRILDKVDRQKRQRFFGADGDEVPRFASPPQEPESAKLNGQTHGTIPPAMVLKSQPEETAQPNATLPSSFANGVSAAHSTRPSLTDAFAAARGHGHHSSGSLSALAKPFQPTSFTPTQPEPAKVEETIEHVQGIEKAIEIPREIEETISELEEGEIRDDEIPTSPIQPGDKNVPVQAGDFTSQHENVVAATEQPSFAELDSIMQQLNHMENKTDVPAEITAEDEADRSISTLPPTPGSQPLKVAPYMPSWGRGEAPSPSPRRRPQLLQSQGPTDSSFTVHERTDSGGQTVGGWPHVTRLNRAEDVPTSDWSDILSPPDEEKFHQRSRFFDSHIDDIIGRVVDSRLQPLEESLRSIESSVNKRTRSTDQYALKRSPSAVLESDADDEDDPTEDIRQRPISRGRDKRVDQIKAAVLEALREQPPKLPEQALPDLSELHSVLADMKVSFARAASSSLELDDIRTVVEETVQKGQETQAVSAAREAAIKDAEAQHKDEISELESRLNQTLAGALEEANKRRAVEEREAESRRLLRLAEDELKSMSEKMSRALEDANRARQDELQSMNEKMSRALEDANSGHDDLLKAMNTKLSQALEEANRSHDDELKAMNEKMSHAMEEANRGHEEELRSVHERMSSALEEADRTHEDQVRSLNEKMSLALEETNRSREIEAQEAETRRVLRLAEEELELLRRTSKDSEERTKVLEDERIQLSQSKDDLEGKLESMSEERIQLLERIEEFEGESQFLRDTSKDNINKIVAMDVERQTLVERAERAEAAKMDSVNRIETLEAEAVAQNETLEEYRASSERWRQDVNEARLETEELESTIAALESQLEDGQEASDNMKRRLEKLHGDMAIAAGQLATEKSEWRAREETLRKRHEVAEYQRQAEIKQKLSLEVELRTLRASAAELTDAKATIDQLRASHNSLEGVIGKLQSDLVEQQSAAARFERDYLDSKEASRSEIHRVEMSAESEVEAANHQVKILRAELETEITRLRSELENVKVEAETAKARHDRVIEEEDTARRDAVRKANQANSAALEETRRRHEFALQEANIQHSRALNHAIEDKQRSEAFLSERLALSDEKLRHYQDRTQHLEERLDIAKSAAQAAALSAQNKAPASYARSSGLPEKVSPQALRESILVLQEQLQDREVQLDRLKNEVQVQGNAMIKERDTEISWLRELLTVRNEELGDLIGELSKPEFNRSVLRDTAIRIRANLDMQLQEKERQGTASPAVGGSALATLSSFATPRAAQLFSKWRSAMENPSLKTTSPRRAAGTPSKAPVASRRPAGYNIGLMTPPASNMRASPNPEVTSSLPAPRLHSQSSQQRLAKPRGLSTTKERQSSTSSVTPLFRPQSYDRDAEDRQLHMPTFEGDEDDEDLDVNASAPAPGFRSLEAELGDDQSSTADSHGDDPQQEPALASVEPIQD